MKGGIPNARKITEDRKVMWNISSFRVPSGRGRDADEAVRAMVRGDPQTLNTDRG